MYQGQELNVEEKSNANVNKSLYKLLIIILRYGKRRRGGMRDSDYDDEDYPRYY